MNALGFFRMGRQIGTGHRLAMSKVAPVACVCASALLAWSATYAVPLAQPLRFFEGRTESIGTMKVVMSKPRRLMSVGNGVIASDGSLTLVQDVRDEGQPEHQRIWHIRQVGPGKWAGTMSDAQGPLTVEQVGSGYRFRFTLRGGLSAEQWLIPNADGKSGASKLTIRKFGMTMAKSEGIIRKLPQQASSFP